ncbi:hypothetical protein [Micromonospora sp. KC721]|uniref:hypothetical protein n=1 Tax=Micromonospora sp. KC721 TaxID=2530380 RepID=UPI00104769DA|nr:hypothetical protein [Micromonospora sp. KC721]TDB81948.1 hypothetical protein E1182_03145 [Micromonospora sp. KC721]
MNALLGLVLVTVSVLTAYVIAGRWGGLYWLFDCLAGAAGAPALLRRPQRIWPAVRGLAVAETVMNMVTWLVAMALGITLRVAARAS